MPPDLADALAQAHWRGRLRMAADADPGGGEEAVDW